jgi:multidrug resistance protein, MATE family
MRHRLLSIRAELAPTFALAWPVVVAELGWMFMGVVDTLMVGWLSPDAIGAVGLGSILFVAVGVFGMGLLLGLDAFVSQAHGAGDLRECHRWLADGVHLAVMASPLVTLVAVGIVFVMPAMGLHPDVQRLTAPYLSIVAWSALPLLLYAAFRRYLQAVGLVRPVMITLIAANVLNAIVNWLLIFGKFGLPALGVAGAAWATVIARVFMAAALFAIIVQHERANRHGLFDVSWRPSVVRLRRLIGLGIPAALQVTAEVGVFAAITALAGRFDPASLAAHQIALNVASVTFMVPLGLASAGAVRVGHAVGRRDAPGAANAGWAAIAIGVGFMAVAAVSFVVGPRALVGAFTSEPAVMASGVVLLRFAAAFQMFDGLQVVTTGVLRGLGDTRTPMLLNLVGHWIFGLPLACLLGFSAGWGVAGLWAGLSASLTLVGLALLVVWRKRIRELGDLAVRPQMASTGAMPRHSPGETGLP